MNSLTLLFIFLTITLSSGVCEEPILWFNSCSSSLEKSAWVLDGAAEEQNGVLRTTTLGGWCRSKLSFSEIRLKMSWMVYFEEGEGSFQVSIGGVKNPIVWHLLRERKSDLGELKWKSKMEASDEIKPIVNDESDIGLLPTNVWVPLVIIRQGESIEILLNGKSIEKLKWSPEMLSIAFKSTGQLKVSCDEFLISTISDDIGTLDDSTMEKGAQMPKGWKQLSGIWSMVALPMKNRMALCQSMETDAALVYEHDLTEGSTISADVRFEMKGQVGLGLFDPKGENGIQIKIRQHLSYGILGERISKVGPEMVFRNEAKILPGIWYHLSAHCKGGFVIVELNGVQMGMLEVSNYGWPRLMSDGVASALFRNVKIVGGKVGIYHDLPIKLSEGGFLKGEWQEETKQILSPIETNPLAEVRASIGVERWRAHWNWLPEKSQSLWLRLTSPTQIFELNLVPYQKNWELALLVEGKWDLPKTDIAPTLMSVINRAKIENPLCVFNTPLSQGPGPKGFDIQVQALLDRGQRMITISIDGRRIGIWPMEMSKDLQMAIGSQGKSELSGLRISEEDNGSTNNFGVEKFDAIEGSLLKCGGSFDDLSLAVGKSMVLSPLMLEGSSIFWNVGGRENGGQVGINLINTKGQMVFSSNMSFMETQRLNWKVDLPAKNEELIKDTPLNWTCGLGIQDHNIIMFLEGKIVQKVPLIEMSSPLFVQWENKQGDFIVYEQHYGWDKSEGLNFIDKSRQKSSLWLWDFSHKEKSSDSRKNNTGILGDMTLKSKLGTNHQILFQSKSDLGSFIGQRQVLEWKNNDSTLRLNFLILEGGCDVQWTLNDKVCGQKRLRSQKILAMVDIDQQKASVWLLGELMAEPVSVSSGEWRFSMGTGSSEAPHIWENLIWRNR